MKGDFSRWTFDPGKHYRRVLMQQGRVQVDSDWNEQQAIHLRTAELEALDIIGPSGAPAANAGFGLSIDANGRLIIGKGRFYVEGLLCENDADTPFDAQADLPGSGSINDQLSADFPVGIVYLDVWERYVSALDDPRIREVALNGPDTAGRSRLVWQVKLLPLAGPLGEAPSCGSAFPEWDALTSGSSGLLDARTAPPETVDSPCLIPPSAGYQRLENQLYRVEIHQGGPLGTATFKWSRDNGSVVTAVESLSGQKLIVADVGPDDVLGFAGGQWVETVDDRLDLLGQPGPLARITDLDAGTRTVTLSAAPAGVDPTLRPRLRRWDSPGEVATASAWTSLEGGIEVQFAAGNYRSGDYWLIPARTATGQIEWPPDLDPNDTGPTARPPLGIEHRFARLALLALGDNGLQITDDCRPVFPPLTAGRKPGIHVTDVQSLDGSQRLRNDDVLPATSLARGLRILLDSEVFEGSLTNSPVCGVTLELPFPFNASDRELWGPDTVIGTTPLTLAAQVSVKGNTIAWQPQQPVQLWLLQRLFVMMTELKRGDRILAHLRMRGNFIWASNDPRRYLDGELFGIQKSVDPPTLARFPSGDDWPGGDLLMWFWLTGPEAPPPPPVPPRIRGLRYLNVGDNPGNPNPRVVASLATPGQNVTMPLQNGPNAIEFQFTTPIDQASVINGKSLVILQVPTSILPGQILFLPDSSTVRWVFRPVTGGFSVMPPGAYRCLVRGIGDPSVTAQGLALDGEPGDQFPTGNNSAGGNYSFSFTIG